MKSTTELTKNECEDAWVSLCVLWDVDQNYWFPLRHNDPDREDIVAFYTPSFEEYVGDSGVRRIIEKKGITRVIELREGGTGEYLTTRDLEIYYSGLEGYWTSEGFDWLIYSSHEQSTTIGGRWLLNEIKAIWPNWNNCLYQLYIDGNYK